MARLGVKPGLRVADVGAGDGYYTVRLAKRLGPGAVITPRMSKPGILRISSSASSEMAYRASCVVHGTPRDPTLPAASSISRPLAHVPQRSENPSNSSIACGARSPKMRASAVIDVDRPTQNHGTPAALLRCELGAVGYRQIDFR